MQPIDYFDRGARLRPNAVAFAQDGESVTYAEASSITHRIAAALASDGVGIGTKIAVYSPNRIDAFLTVLGILRSGATWVPINIRNGLADNIAILSKTDCTGVFYFGEYEHELNRIRQELPNLRLVIPLDVLRDDATDGKSWMASAGSSFPRLLTQSDRISVILSTGGTTGQPKGVVWHDQTWECMIASFWAHMPYDEGQPTYLVAAPMTHAAGIISFPLMAVGAKIVIIDKPDARVVMSTIERERVSHLFMPPTVIYTMLADPEVRRFDYSSLRYFIYSAAPMAAAKIREAIDVFGPVMAQAYGQAEVPLMGTFLGPREHVEILATGAVDRFASCGRPCMFVDLAILDHNGRVAAPNEKGEIAFRGNLVAPGYYKDKKATAAVRLDEWHLTGDVGYKDDDGYVYIVDRKKDMIITGGFNVYSIEVEQQILTHPSVKDCAVIGIPDEKWGEAVVAIVEPKAGIIIPPDDIIDLCRARLGGVKTPKFVQIWDALPRSVNGKVLKRSIRDSFWQDQDRMV